MKTLIIGINLTDINSTGTIMINSLDYAQRNGPFDCVALVPQTSGLCDKPVKIISFKSNNSKYKIFYYRILRKLKGKFEDGEVYKENTNNIIKIINNYRKEYKQIIIHLHNVHHCELDICKLYNYLRKTKLPILYTLHDCWAFTGGCYYFFHCNKWEKKCLSCPEKILRSNKNLHKRIKAINKIENLKLICCSNWLKDCVLRSQLKDKKIYVNYGETSITRYEGISKLKESLGIINKKILLSVSSYWGKWKGEEYLYQLADILPNDYVLLVIGGHLQNENHMNIIHVNDILDKKILSEYYSIGDVFISVTQNDNLPLVLMEAQICGLPVVGFGHGGTPEEITEKSGIMVGIDNDVNKLFKAIQYVINEKPFEKKNIIESGNRFKEYECAKRQYDIYKETFDNAKK